MLKTFIKNIVAIVIVTTIVFASYSCKKFIEIAPPDGQPITSTVFSDDQTATSAINGLYSQMMVQNFSIMNSGVTLYPALSGDELFNTLPDITVAPFTNNAIPSNSLIIESNFWRKAYNHIYNSNAILEGLSRSQTLTPPVKSQLLGEAKFVRALCYFYLINLFGDVPLIRTTNYQEGSIIARTDIDEIYNQIINDLTEAREQMGNDYPSAGKVRPNKWAAATLLARVYLYRGRWADAETQATSIINSGNYGLSPLSSVYLANSSEAIWQLLPVLTFLNTADAFTFIPYSTTVRPQYAITDWLLNAFEPNDQRRSAWLTSNVVNGQPYYYPYKYKVRSGNTVTEYNMVLRFAEVYLIRAEARTQQNNFFGAQSDLNAIRNRAGLPNTAATDQASLLTAIEHERQIEFFAEWGHRWFDLKRTQRIDAVLGIEKPTWQTTDALYPLPLSELQLNTALTQNTGY